MASVAARRGPLVVLYAIGVLIPDRILASTTFSYDPLGRLTTAAYDNGACIAYSYDANGNRTSQINTTGGGPVSAVWGAGKWGCMRWAP